MARLVVKSRPHLHAGQEQVYADKRRFRIVRAGRRWGKTKLGVWECLEAGLKGGIAWWVAPSYKLGKPGWRDLAKLARRIPGVSVNKGERTITFPNGGEVAVRTAANPDDLRAEGLDFVVLDEAAFMDPAAWYEALRPALADKRGRALFISTPKGTTNWLATLWAEAASQPDVWGLWVFSTATNPYIDADEIEAMRHDLGELLYRQEVLAEFVELEGTIIKPQWFRYWAPATIYDEARDDWRDVYVLDDGLEVPADECWQFITADVALSLRTEADYTVFCVFAAWDPPAATMRAWEQTRLHLGAGEELPPKPQPMLLLVDLLRGQMEAPDVVAMGERLRRRWKARWVGYESVAYQASLVQFARRRGQAARALRPDGDKVARAMGLAARLEAGEVAFPAEAPWLDVMEQELLLFPNAEHDDQVDALAYGANELSGRRWAAH